MRGMKLSANFRLDEFERSQTALRHGINNAVPPHLLDNLRRLVVEILQPFRDHSGPITISSGYRCRTLNDRIGGSRNSQHMDALAADFRVQGERPLDTCRRLAAMPLPFDQLIHEFGGWTHVSAAPRGRAPRRQLLTIDAQGTREGLHEVRG